MVVITMVQLFFPVAQSRQEEHRTTRGILDQLRHRFNLSVMVQAGDEPRTAWLVMAGVHPTLEEGRKMARHAIELIEQRDGVEVLAVEEESF